MQQSDYATVSVVTLGGRYEFDLQWNVTSCNVLYSDKGRPDASSTEGQPTIHNCSIMFLAVGLYVLTSH